MKKLIAFLLMSLLIIFMPQTVFADTENEAYEKIISEINEGLDAAADDDVKDVLQENDLSVDNPSAINEIKAENIIERLYEYFTDALKKPLVMLGKIIAVTLICVLIKNISPDSGSMSKTFGIIGILTTITVISDAVSENIYSLKDSLERINDFMVSYIPVFSSVVAAGGSAASGGSYYAVMLLICEAAAVIADKVLIPFLSAVMAITLVSAVNPNLQFAGIAESVKKLVTWILGIVMTLFVGLMSIQSFAGTAADSLASRAVKFAASSFIPVIGGSVSEAYSTVKGSLGVIRTSVGTIGIIMLVIIISKPLISVLAVKFTVWIGRIINDIFGMKECSEFLKSINAVMSIGLSIVIAYSIVFVISTSVVMMTAMNAGV